MKAFGVQSVAVFSHANDFINGRHGELLGVFEGVSVNGGRNLSTYGEVKFPSLAGGAISPPVDQALRFLAAFHDV
jgi:hypothetical protein